MQSVLKEQSSQTVVKNLILHPWSNPMEPYFSFPNLPRSSHLPTQCNFMFSLSLSRKKKKEKKGKKRKHSKKDFLKMVTYTKWNLFCVGQLLLGMGTSLECGRQTLHWRNWFSVYSQASIAQSFLIGVGLCVHFLFVGSLCKHHDQQSVNPHEAGRKSSSIWLGSQCCSNFESSTPSILF